MSEHTESEPPKVGYKRKTDFKTPEEERLKRIKRLHERQREKLPEILEKRNQKKEINNAAETLVTMKNTTDMIIDPNKKIGRKKTRRKRNNKRKKSKKNK